jgi:hypothetical protein
MKKLTSLAIAALLLAGCAPGGQPLPFCQDENYSGPIACHWDAQQQGNGSGRSFTWTGTDVIYAK